MKRRENEMLEKYDEEASERDGKRILCNLGKCESSLLWQFRSDPYQITGGSICIKY
jgi:hypothetical protein